MNLVIEAVFPSHTERESEHLKNEENSLTLVDFDFTLGVTDYVLLCCKFYQ